MVSSTNEEVAKATLIHIHLSSFLNEIKEAKFCPAKTELFYYQMDIPLGPLRVQ
jgi:hypothetical protein